MTQLNRDRIVAIVVTYQPELEILEQLLDALAAQVESVVIIDNGSKVDLQTWNNQRQRSTVEVILTGENLGIAAAHNMGIQWALSRGVEYVLLMDQDSIPKPDMVQKLTFALSDAEKNFDALPIAAGPINIDMRTGNKSFFVSERHGIPVRWWPRLASPTFNSTREVSTLISSGTLINLRLFKSVGGMRSNYFIDHVDTEWCFRVKARGYILLGVADAFMSHTLGDKVKNIWFFGWRHVAYHSPLRDYYMFRNTLLMCRDVQMSFMWRLHLTLRIFKFLGYFLLFTPQRVHRFYCMALGVAHGLRGISGKVDLKTGQCTQIPKSDLDP